MAPKSFQMANHALIMVRFGHGLETPQHQHLHSASKQQNDQEVPIMAAKLFQIANHALIMARFGPEAVPIHTYRVKKP